MRILIQRVSEASVTVGGEVAGAIGQGLLLLVGFGQEDAGDTPDRQKIGPVMDAMLAKVVNLRIFNDDDGKMNRSLLDTGGSLLVVSQFTLHADCRKGRRPSYTHAAPPAEAEGLYDDFVRRCRAADIHTETGRFGTMMDVRLLNDGPVTIWLDSETL